MKQCPARQTSSGRKSWRLAWFAGVVSACGSILGFDEHTVSDPGAAGDGERAGSGGTSPLGEGGSHAGEAAGFAGASDAGFGGNGAGGAGAGGMDGHCLLRDNEERQRPTTIYAPSCHAGQDEHCESTWVPGGRFQRTDGQLPIQVPACAAISGFYLDKYEVSVARFRRFVDQYDAWYGAGNPKPDAGAHPKIDLTGWQSAWNQELPANASVLGRSTSCQPPPVAGTTASDSLPITCVDWYVAAAFCLWDQGRLPTEAEWVFAAAGGSQLRRYPWGNAPPTPTLALYGSSPLLEVGSAPDGAARWGQLDMAGSVYEWVFDYHWPFPASCTNCANWYATATDDPPERGYLGGSYQTPERTLEVAKRGHKVPHHQDKHLGIRCARDP